MARLSFPLEGLPADHSNTASQLVECARLKLEKDLLKACRGGLHCNPQMLRDSMEGPDPGILDVGTGSGEWAIYMAHKFPSAEVLGVDVATVPISGVPPNNCQFVQDDFKIYTNLRHYGWSFNLVHLRAWECNVRNWDDLLDDIHGVLRPGGVLLIIEANSQIVGRDGRPIQAVDEEKPGFSWVVEYMRTAEFASTGLHSSEEHASSVGLASLSCLESQTQWHRTGAQEVAIQLGGPKDLAEQSNQIKQDVMQLCASFRPLLLLNGLPESTVEGLIRNVEQELEGGEVYTYVKWIVVWAQKRPIEYIA